ncbi:MAG: hypothetical protein R3E48_05265 [Burkholderiaceae bacterium]
MTHAYVAPHKAAPEPGLTRPVRRDRQCRRCTGDSGRPGVPGSVSAQAWIVLHKDYDGSHPSLYGTYLAAATCYAAIYGKSPVGNSYDYFGKIAPDMAKFLQRSPPTR